MKIGERIKIKRLAKNLTLEELATMLNLSRQTLSRYETGVISNIPSDTIERIAKILEASPAYFMGWENPKGEIDLGLAELDIAKLLGVPSSVVSSVMDEYGLRVGLDGEKLFNVATQVNEILTGNTTKYKPKAYPNFELNEPTTQIYNKDSARTANEGNLIKNYRLFNKDGQQKILDYMDDLISSEKYTNDSDDPKKPAKFA